MSKENLLIDFFLPKKLTATNTSFWKKLKMEKNRKSSEAKLHHKKVCTLNYTD